LREGVNPELEMGRFLTEASPYANIAPVLGAAELIEPGAEPVTLAVLQRYVENQGDLWSLACQHLSRMLSMPAAQSARASPAEAVAVEFHIGRMALLGRRVAELHHALAKATGDAAFDPEPITARDLEAWKASIEHEMEETFAIVERTIPGLAPERRAEIAALAGLRQRLRGKIRATTASLDALVKTRYHGDLHLGQVLVAQDDFVIVDFEGEPERPVAERRAKGCVLRDVAGMLRSFSYAAHAAALRREAGAPAVEAGVRALADWERDAARHFLLGYRQAAQGLASAPAGEDAFAALVDLFLVEKALYELRYEMENRPDWVAIPARGLIGLAQR